jgi:hypothetical protein
MQPECEISRREADENSYFLERADISGIQPETPLTGGTCCEVICHFAGGSASQVKPSLRISRLIAVKSMKLIANRNLGRDTLVSM